jgi:hypothetical protein
MVTTARDSELRNTRAFSAGSRVGYSGTGTAPIARAPKKAKKNSSQVGRTRATVSPGPTPSPRSAPA